MEGCIGVDIGGSGVRAARVEGGRVGPTRRQPLADREVRTVVDAVVAAVAPLRPAQVGVGVPGFIFEQRVVASPNFPAWKEVPLAEMLADRFGVPVTVENDANAAALGVWRERGGGEDLVVLTLGTGVGGGVVTGGQLLRGARGTGAELGHVYAGGDAPCGCGGAGCLEMWCGTVGLSRLAAAHHPPITGGASPSVTALEGREIVDAADRGEAWAAAVLEQAAEGLGRGLVTLVNVFNPDAVVICGGLANAKRWLGEPAERWLRKRAVRPSAEHVQVVWEGRADHFAILGAAEVARFGREAETLG